MPGSLLEVCVGKMARDLVGDGQLEAQFVNRLSKDSEPSAVEFYDTEQPLIEKLKARETVACLQAGLSIIEA